MSHFYLQLLPLLHLVKAVSAFSDSCNVEWLTTGTTYTLKQMSGSCDSYNWLADGTVIANEENFNTTVVHSRGHWYITLHSCHPEVSYRNPCTGKSENCSNSCPTTPHPKEDPSTYTGNRHAVIIYAVGAVMLLILVVLCWRYFQSNTSCRSRCNYTAAESGQAG